MNGDKRRARRARVWKFINLGLELHFIELSEPASSWEASQALSTLARMEAMDGVSSQCLQSVGNYNQQRGNNLQPQAALTQSQFDTSSFTTTELEQLNLINMHNAHGLNEAQSQGALHACQAAQRPLSQTWLSGLLRRLRSTMRLRSSSRGRAIPPRRRTAQPPGRITCPKPEMSWSS